jgi:hypothetical protein
MEGISLDDIQAALARRGDHLLVGIDAAGRDAGGLQERENSPRPQPMSSTSLAPANSGT